MEVFKASVQYNNLKGTVKADEATHHIIMQLLG